MLPVFQETLNFGRYETWTHKPEFHFHHVTQVHGTDIVHIHDLPQEADGLFVSHKEFSAPLAIKTADCMPIVIEGLAGIVFLHAGWKGLASGILKSPRIKDIEPLRAFIGPSIHDCCFEVSQDFRENFPQSSHFKKDEGKLFFNLQKEAQDILKELYPKLLVEIAPICTMCNHSFHSYRRNKTIERNWNVYIKG